MNPFQPAVIDIETVASPVVSDLLDPVRAPAHYKDPFKIQTYQMDKLAERIATASLEPDLCEIVALGFDNELMQAVMSRADLDEGQMLEWFWDHVGGGRFIGYNILKFDLPVLIRRSQLLGVTFPHISLDRYRTTHVDLLERLSFNGAITYRSLNFYVRRFGLDCDEDTVQGHEIPSLVAEADWPAITHHCLCDIQKTKALAQRLGLLSTVAA